AHELLAAAMAKPCSPHGYDRTSFGRGNPWSLREAVAPLGGPRTGEDSIDRSVVGRLFSWHRDLSGDDRADDHLPHGASQRIDPAKRFAGRAGGHGALVVC